MKWIISVVIFCCSFIIGLFIAYILWGIVLFWMEQFYQRKTMTVVMSIVALVVTIYFYRLFSNERNY